MSNHRILHSAEEWTLIETQRRKAEDEGFARRKKSSPEERPEIDGQLYFDFGGSNGDYRPTA